MEPEHPYRPPTSELGGPSVGESGSITPGMVEALKKTRPWALFVGIMALLGCGLMVVLALVMTVVGSSMPAEASPFPGVVLGLLYLVLAALYIYPAIRLLRFAAAIKRIGGVDSARAIEDALVQQLGFWRFVGIIMIVMIACYALIFVGVIIFGVATGLGQ